MKIKGNLLPWAIIFAGVAYSLYLISLVPEGAFFSGDGGLKALLAEQLSRGEFRADLVQPQEAWVRQLWQEGLYPYEPPFVYHLNDKYFISFPFPFPAISAPFYALFGYWGLYIIPLISTWAIWITACWACQRLRFSNWQTSLALTALIFASNLTVYSAMYWEHTLAVSLCFAAMVILLIPQNEAGLSPRNAIFGGCLLGLSVWFRSELVAMVASLVFLVYFVGFAKYIHRSLTFSSLDFLQKHRELFFVSTFLTIGLFFACNQLIYGRPLGIHALLITENFSWMKRAAEAWNSFRSISVRVFEYFPFAIVSLFYLVSIFFQKICGKFNFKVAIFSCVALWLAIGVLFFPIAEGISDFKIFLRQGIIPLIIIVAWLYLLRNQKIEMNARLGFIYGLSLLFIIGVSLLVDYAPGEVIVGGKQWGNRYVLVLLPWLSLLAAQEIKNIHQLAQPVPKNFSLAIAGILLVVGIQQNSYLGALFLADNYQGVTPAIQALRQNPERFVAVSHQYAAQMLEPELGGEKIFFRAADEKSLIRLATALKAQNESEFIYVCYPYRECKLPQESPEKLKFTNRQGRFKINLSKLGILGKYPTYKGSIN
jgi:hypothetical protein